MERRSVSLGFYMVEHITLTHFPFAEFNSALVETFYALCDYPL
jgi:hypothetical protein